MQPAKLPGDTRLFINIPIMVAVLPYHADGIYLKPVPERERWRTVHQFTVIWLPLAVLWTMATSTGAWLPIGTAASAIVSRASVTWLQHRREHRAVRE